MRYLFNIFVLIGMISSVSLPGLNPAQALSNSDVPDSSSQSGSGMPGWPVPDKPIPVHEPGRPSRAESYTTQAVQENELGVAQLVTLSGVEAMTADGLDPLAGNYRLVGKEDIALGVYDIDDYSIELETYRDNTIDPVLGSDMQLAPAGGSEHQSFDLTAGDLNGDGVDEQIAAWVEVDTRHIMLAIGEMPGTNGRSSSEPAAAASGNQVDLLVRGYDQALWHTHYDGTTSMWEDWKNDGGGLLLSGPAIASRGDAAFDVFAVGSDNQIYQRQWTGSAWAGSWSELPVDPVFSTVPAWIGQPPELPAPAAVARGTDQLDVFRLAPDRTLRWNHFNGSSWSSWSSLGGMFAYGPGAVLLADGRLQVFTIGVDQALWYLLSDGSGWEMDGGTCRWQRVELNGMAPDVTPDSPPSAVQLATGEIRVFVRASDDALWQIIYADGSWGAWSKGGAGLASRPTAAVSSAGLFLFGLTPDGSLQKSLGGTTWVGLDQPWLPACCLGTPIDTEIYAYATAETNPVEQLNLLDIETGHFLGDGRQQIALAYTWADPAEATQTGIGLQLFDVNDGFTTLNMLGQIDNLQHEEDYYPKIAVGEFDWDAPQEIALAYATRRGGVRVYTGTNSTGRQIAWLKPRKPNPSLTDQDSWYFLWDEDVEPFYGDDMNNSISSIDIADGWMACVKDKWADPPQCFDSEDELEDLGEVGLDESISYVYVEMITPGSGNIHVNVTDGIINQRNAYIALEVFNIEPLNSTPVLQAVDYYEMWFTDTDDYPAPERTLGIVAGDFDGTRNILGQLNDEIALIWDKICRGDLCSNYRAYFHILDVEPGADGMSISDHRAIEIEKFALDSDDPRDPDSAEINLTAGDFDGEGKDEIARTWPRNFEGGLYPNLDRNLVVLDWDEDDNEWKTYTKELPDSSIHNYEDALAAGDLDLDLQDEIVYNEAYNNKVEVYSFIPVDDGIKLDGSKEIDNPDYDVLVLATGDFSGESLRVGQPTYRHQYDVGQVIAVVNAPPKHKDVIDRVEYNLNADQEETYSRFEQVVGSSTEVSVTTKKDWGVDSEFKVTVGDPDATHVTTSLENSYGENFADTGSSIQSMTYTQSVSAITEDVLYYTRLDYDVWEYPVYDRLTNQPQGYMSVVWPVGGMHPVIESANACDGWYQPNHQLMNVWSYPSRDSQLLDRDGLTDLVSISDYEIGTSQVDYSVEFTSVSSEQRAHEYEMGFAAGLETQIGGEEVGVNLGLVSFSTRLPSMYFSTRSHYEYSELSTWKTETSTSTKLSGYFAPFPLGSTRNYYVHPYLYWSQGDYLVQDYVTDPSSASFWSSSGDNYDRPDPAFIHPWSDGQCNHLWADSRYFTSDISIDPPMAALGDPVKITVTLRNFSKVGNGNSPYNKPFKVAFYHGDPASGGVKIGEGTIALGELGPRAVLTRSIDWVAQGSGEQHIYVVIDSEGVLPEVHEDNNKGYGVLHMDVIDFVDVGQAQEKAYQAISLQLGQAAPVATLQVPLEAFSANLRIDLRAALDYEAEDILGLPFEVIAYQTNWDEPMAGFSLRPAAGNPPGVILIDYTEADLGDFDEGSLALYRYNGLDWENASLSCGEPSYQTQRFPGQDLMAVPVCEVGIFALSDAQPVPPSIEPPKIYLPVTMR